MTTTLYRYVFVVKLFRSTIVPKFRISQRDQVTMIAIKSRDFVHRIKRLSAEATEVEKSRVEVDTQLYCEVIRRTLLSAIRGYLYSTS